MSFGKLSSRSGQASAPAYGPLASPSPGAANGGQLRTGGPVVLGCGPGAGTCSSICASAAAVLVGCQKGNTASRRHLHAMGAFSSGLQSSPVAPHGFLVASGRCSPPPHTHTFLCCAEPPSPPRPALMAPLASRSPHQHSRSRARWSRWCWCTGLGTARKRLWPCKVRP